MERAEAMPAALEERGAMALSRYGLRAWAGLVALVVSLHAVLALVARPYGEFLVDDSWAYVLSVERLRETGEMRILEWNPMSLVAHVGFGAAWTAVFGFSWADLALSVTFLSVVGALFFALLCREMGVSAGCAGLVVAATVLNPLWAFHAIEFNTDVPFVTWTLVGVWAYVRGRRLKGVGWLVGASAAWSVAFLIRQPAALFVVAAVVQRIVEGLARPQRLAAVARDVAALAVVPVVTAAGFFIWYLGMHGPTATFVLQISGVLANLDVTHLARMPLFVASLAVYLALFSVPWLPTLFTAAWREARGRFLWTAAVSVLLGGALAYALYGSYLQFAGLRLPNKISPFGVMRLNSTIIGDRPYLFTPPWQIGLTFLGAASVCFGLLWWASVRIPAWWRSKNRSRRLAEWIASPAAFLVVVVVLFLGYFGVSPSFFDRHLLPVVPPVLVLCAWGLRGHKMRAAWGVVLLVPMAWWTLATTQDYFAMTRMRWKVAEDLVTEGVAPRAIDNGYEWNSYYGAEERGGQPIFRLTNADYVTALSTTVRRYPHRDDGPWSMLDLSDYEIVARTPFRTWVSPSRRVLLLLKRHSVPADAEAPASQGS